MNKTMFELILSPKWSGISNESYDNFGEDNYLIYTNNLVDFQAELDGVNIDYHNNKLTINTDRFNTVPVYFTFLVDRWIITDNLGILLKKSKFQIDPGKIFEFLNFDFVFTNYTTHYINIFRAPAKSCTELYSNGYYNPVSQEFNFLSGYSTKSKTDFNEESTLISKNIKSQLAQYDSLYIPLSGGMDSRLVMGIAEQIPQIKIFSRTYGDKNSLDVKYGSLLAKNLNINHEIVSKDDNVAMMEFERTVIETAGSLNGVHGHDLEGKDKFERGETQARVSGFIGDLLARGALIKEEGLDRATAKSAILKKGLLINRYAKILDPEFYSLNLTGLEQAIDIYLDDYNASVGDYSSVNWDFYITKHVSNMTSVLEYFTHFSKPNIKPFAEFDVAQFIVQNSFNDVVSGENYARFARKVAPKVMKVPLSSNSVFFSKFNEIIFKLKRRKYKFENKLLSKLGLGTKHFLSFNATLNWFRILSKNPKWVNDNIQVASTLLPLNLEYISEIYLEHQLGKANHTTVLLRLISVGIMVKNNL